ncbi:hypothetical protein [Kribbella speibonae]|uniref:Uncharacterized protein n=1 Tax=Kribbella speibonae TaxID=1572660 RepID=A0ABY2A210_9ACTN|nr:hypothetical protein [Kribbella speibonae]TCC20315.1 hypothetical protein E0H58_29815 [Kribbella speibonae]
MVNVAAVNVLSGIGPATWSAPQAMAFEIAQEGVRQAIGFYAHLIGTEQSAAEPDAAAIAGWRAEQEAWAARGRELTPLDVRAIKRIRKEADDLLIIDDEDDDDENEDDEDEASDDEDDDVADDDDADDGETLGRP